MGMMVNSQGYLLDGFYIHFTSMPENGSPGTGAFVSEGRTANEFSFTMSNGVMYGTSLTGERQRFIIKFSLFGDEVHSLQIIFSDRSTWEFVREEVFESPVELLDWFHVELAVASF